MNDTMPAPKKTTENERESRRLKIRREDATSEISKCSRALGGLDTLGNYEAERLIDVARDNLFAASEAIRRDMVMQETQDLRIYSAEESI